MELFANNVVNYATQRGLLHAEWPRVELLAGGISSTLLRLHAKRGPMVVKQALPQFRTKTTWLVDPARNRLEAQVQTYVRTVLGAEHVPQVLDIDRDRFAFTMASAPLAAQNWQTLLLVGQVAPELGAQCGRLLAKLHQISAANEHLPDELRETRFFRLQRLEPFLEFTAKRHPDVAGEMMKLVKMLSSAKETLTHGDFTPRNILVADGNLMLLDYEVAHVGWPEFDVASMVAHLTLNTIHLPGQRPALRETVAQFLAALQPRAGWLPCVGALMLASVDGRLPVEYLSKDEKLAVRATAKDLLCGRLQSMEELFGAADRV